MLSNSQAQPGINFLQPSLRLLFQVCIYADIVAVAISLTDDRHVGVLHEGEVAGRDGDLAQVGPREVDLHVLDHHASLVGRRDLQGMLHI